MPTALVGKSISIGGETINKSVTRTGDGTKNWRLDLPAADAGTLTTRTSDSVGEITMASGHAIQTGDTIDIYWSGGVRYGITVGTVSGDAVPITGGSGDVLPSSSTALTADVQVQINTAIDGDNIIVLGLVLDNPDANATSKGHVDFQDNGSLTIHQETLAANDIKEWDILGGDTNDFTGNPVEKALCSNGDASNAVTLRIMELEDNTP